jgi:hypothetical protein
MERREALKLLAGAAALPLLSRDALALFQQVHQSLPETAALKVLDPHQNAAVVTIAELIIPQTDTPGAKAVRVNEFIDRILAEWYTEEEKSSFLAGLAQVDTRSHDLFGKDFVDCSQTQQTQILTELDEGLAEMRKPARTRWRHQPVREQPFFYRMKELTLVGYYTSEVGFEEELHESTIPPQHAGCAPLEEETGH